MQSTVKGLYHDAAALRRFVDDSKLFCEEAKHESYVGASQDFFVHIRELATKTIAFLDRLPAQQYPDDLKIRAERQKLVLIKKYWSVVHRFIKPATDANTLKVPVPLVDFLSDLANISALPPAKIVILLSQELNYFQYRHTGLKDVYLQLQGVVPDAPTFPDGLGFIGIPYSQGSNFFTNLVIFHELGHFFFEETLKEDDLIGPIEDALNQWGAFSTLNAQDQAWSRQLLLGWAEEIYCDLFAIKLIGPSYSLAFSELFNLIGLFEPDRVKRFCLSHPSDACRFREHVKQLEADGWWSVVRCVKCEHVELIEELATLDEQTYEFVLDDGQVAPREFIDAFLKLLPQVRQEIATTFANTKPAVEVFEKYNNAIQECLLQGIVPSAIFEATKLSAPSESIALLNSAFFFYLTLLEKLISNISNQKPDPIENRGFWTRKLEAWILKALENVRLLENQGN
jgi:hypothetical protein